MIGLLAPVASAQMPPNRWTFEIRFQETGSENARFLQIPNRGDVTSIVDTLSSSVTFSRRTPKNDLALSGRIAGNRFRDFSDLDGAFVSAGFHFARRTTPRFTWMLSQAYSDGINPQTLTAAGFLPSRVDAQRYQARSGFSYQASSRTSMSLYAHYDWTRFNALRRIEGSQIVLEQPPFAEEIPGSDELGGTPGEEPLPTAPEADAFVLDVLASEGLEDPRVTSQAGGINLGVSHRVSLKTTLSLGAFYTHRYFDALRLTDGGNFGASGRLSRIVTERDTLSAAYSFRRSLSQTPAVDTHNLVGAWSRVVRKQQPAATRFNLSGGVSYFRASDVGRDDLSPFVNVAVTSQLTRSTTMSARYTRRYIQSLGFGRNLLSDFASASIGQSIGRRFLVGAFAGYTLSRDPLEPDSRFAGELYSVFASFAIARELSIGASYAKRKNDSRTGGPFVTFDTNVWAFFVTYGRSWPRTGGP